MIDVLFLAKEDLWKILNWKKANERLEAILAADDEDDDLNEMSQMHKIFMESKK